MPKLNCYFSRLTPNNISVVLNASPELINRSDKFKKLMPRTKRSYKECASFLKAKRYIKDRDFYLAIKNARKRKTFLYPMMIFAENETNREHKMSYILGYFWEIAVVLVDINYITLYKMARPERFELPTNRFEAGYSIQLSYGRIFAQGVI